MGLLAREIEAKGVTTVGLALVKEVAVAARAPRFLYLHWPFGHALGEPGNVPQQRRVLHDMLSMASCGTPSASSPLQVTATLTETSASGPFGLAADVTTLDTRCISSRPVLRSSMRKAM